MEKVQTEIQTDEDKDILVEHDVKFGPPVNQQTQNRKRKLDTASDQISHASSHKSNDWQEVKPFLTAKDNLKGTDPGKYAPKSGLEKKIDTAIKKGDFKTAEDLSDKLANREVSDVYEINQSSLGILTICIPSSTTTSSLVSIHLSLFSSLIIFWEALMLALLVTNTSQFYATEGLSNVLADLWIMKLQSNDLSEHFFLWFI
ncbi:hypothetical protein FSP39_008836 [Pinctada imbricata]|uniref:Uncharacterized protein n=1 Tax=Pinctada imbricata TaxID=66713 RepID=A0AA89BYC1_PINIB|nr:hypothetical protein FSP39_008836 [Pinctada imbricata]